jgi:hypothetical protein
LSLSPLPKRAQLLVEIKKKKSSSIEEVMEELHSIDEVNCGSALLTFATEFFCSTSKREM